MIALISLAFCVCGCDKDRKAEPAPPPPSAAVEQPAAEPSEESDDPAGGPRPEHIDLTLTAARREKIESEIPEARGFLVASELEGEVEALNKINKEALVKRWLDEQAEGKWVLFTGPYNKVEGEQFQLPFNYAKKSKRDPFGMSKMWVFVRFDNVKGHNTLYVSEGKPAAVLAKYKGSLQAAPGYDLVAMGLW